MGGIGGEDAVFKRFILRVEPDGGDAGVVCALDVGGEGVADDEAFGLVEGGDERASAVEKFALGLPKPHRLGDENALEEVVNPTAFKAEGLGGFQPVGYHEKAMSARL